MVWLPTRFANSAAFFLETKQDKSRDLANKSQRYIYAERKGAKQTTAILLLIIEWPRREAAGEAKMATRSFTNEKEPGMRFFGQRGMFFWLNYY